MKSGKLEQSAKDFYDNHHGIHPSFINVPEVEEFLFWVYFGINPKDHPTKHEWSGNYIVGDTLDIYFDRQAPLSVAIELLDLKLV